MVKQEQFWMGGTRLYPMQLQADFSHGLDQKAIQRNQSDLNDLVHISF